MHADSAAKRDEYRAAEKCAYGQLMAVRCRRHFHRQYQRRDRQQQELSLDARAASSLPLTEYFTILMPETVRKTKVLSRKNNVRHRQQAGRAS